MRARGRGGRIRISTTQFTVSLDVPVTAFEGASATTTPLNVNCTRAGNIGFTGTVDWAVTGSGTNPATVADFGGAFPSGTLNFGAEETAKLIALTIHGNDTDDGDRTFTVTLTNATTTGGSGIAAIGIAAVICTIIDDDGATPTTFVSYEGDEVYYGPDPTTYGSQ